MGALRHGVIAALALERHCAAEPARERTRPGARRDNDVLAGDTAGVRHQAVGPSGPGSSRARRARVTLAPLRTTWVASASASWPGFPHWPCSGRNTARLNIRDSEGASCPSSSWSRISILTPCRARSERPQASPSTPPRFSIDEQLAMMLDEPLDASLVHQRLKAVEGEPVQRSHRHRDLLDARPAAGQQKPHEPRQRLRQIGEADIERPFRIGEPLRYLLQDARHRIRQTGAGAERAGIAEGALRAGGSGSMISTSKPSRCR